MTRTAVASKGRENTISIQGIDVAFSKRSRTEVGLAVLRFFEHHGPRPSRDPRRKPKISQTVSQKAPLAKMAG